MQGRNMEYGALCWLRGMRWRQPPFLPKFLLALGRQPTLAALRKNTNERSVAGWMIYPAGKNTRVCLSNLFFGPSAGLEEENQRS